MRLREFAPAGGGGSGNYFQALASAWYNGVFDTGSLPRGIKTQEDVERLLNRGIVAPDGKMRRYHIDYNGDFDGVEIYSDDYYEHGDYDASIDSRTGQKWGPYDFMSFSDEDLSEGAPIATTPGSIDPGGAVDNFKQQMANNTEIAYQKAQQGGLNEFAPDDSGDSGEEDILHKYARMWWNGDDATQQQIEAVLAQMGWEIGEDEGGYDNGGVFVVRAGDENGRSYTSWPAEDLAEGVAEGHSDQQRKIFKKNGKPVGEVGIDPEASPGNGQWYMTCYGVVSYGGYDSYEEAVAELKHCLKQGVAEGSDPFGPQGRYVGDTGPKQITATVARVPLRTGDRVIYKPTEQRATIEALSQDGTKARIHIASAMGGRTFNCEVADLRAVGRGSLEEKSTSQAQFRTMAAAAHNPKFARKVGIKQSVAKEFHKADKGQSYKSLPKRAD